MNSWNGGTTEIKCQNIYLYIYMYIYRRKCTQKGTPQLISSVKTKRLRWPTALWALQYTIAEHNTNERRKKKQQSFFFFFSILWQQQRCIINRFRRPSGRFWGSTNEISFSPSIGFNRFLVFHMQLADDVAMSRQQNSSRWIPNNFLQIIH